MENIDEKKFKVEPENKRINIQDLAPYARQNHKMCLGRGFLKMLNSKGQFKEYQICSCVLRNKKVQELFDKVNEEAKKALEEPESKKIEEAVEEAVEEK